MNNILESIPGNWQSGLCLLALPILKNFSKLPSVEVLCEFMQHSTSSAYQGKKAVENLLSIDKVQEHRSDHQFDILEFENQVLKFELNYPSSRIRGHRNSFSDVYKQFVIKAKGKYQLSWEEISKTLDIPIETLKKFSRDENMPQQITEGLSPQLVELINHYLRSDGKKSAKNFHYTNEAMMQDIGLKYRPFCKLLLDLGLASPTGLFKTRTVLDKIIKFNPLMIWGTDGKEITIEINGKYYKWVWQCLIDYTTTVIVGGLIDKTENTDNLFTSLKVAQDKWKVTPIAIVMDNRLSENLPAIRKYLDQYDIQIIKTFPGNPKSNGITEGNFSIFEHYMGGKVTITGDNDECAKQSANNPIGENPI